MFPPFNAQLMTCWLYIFGGIDSLASKAMHVEHTV